ncbi:YhgE/Pip domain-containing protein [Corynebacterium pseudokroppenstedtii]|uniref:YhgE/Pip domain-containing protein n=1 Tax=Corynebacterium pseudokroppenstedtii TaxID=2804917 RepID=UPI003079D54C
MISGLNLGSELRRFRRSKLGRLAVAAIILIPLLYSCLYLWAFWNPFGHVEKLPVAFVNDDKGTSVNGKPLQAGDQIVDKLKSNKEIDFDFVSNDKATKGVEDGEYYFMVRLTPDFSKAVASPSGTKAEQAVIQSNYNSTNGYLATLIGQNTMRELVPVISSTLGDQVVGKVLVSMQEAGAGISQAAEASDKLQQGSNEIGNKLGDLKNGADQLDSGLGTAHNGATQLAAGATKLNGGATELSQGATTLHDKLAEANTGVNTLSEKMGEAKAGSDKIHDGIGQVDSKLGEVSDGSAKLAAGADQMKAQVEQSTASLGDIDTKMGQLTGGLDQLGTVATQVNGGVQQINGIAQQASKAQTAQSDKVRAIAGQLRGSSDPAAQNMANQLDTLATQIDSQGLGKNSDDLAKVSRLSQGTSALAYQLNDPSADFRGGINQLAAGAGPIKGKIDELTNGLDQLSNGANTVASGSRQLRQEGTMPLVQASGQLSSGLGQLDDGARTLKDGMPQAVQGSAKLADGGKQLAGGTTQLKDGATKLSSGTTRLQQGAQQLSDGAGKLQEGSGKVTSGLGELKEKLGDGAKKVPSWTTPQREASARVMSDPAKLSAKDLSGNQVFGTGLAPFFFSLAMFIGGLITFLLLRPMQNRAVASGVAPLRAALDGLWPASIIAMLQATMIIVVTLTLVGMDVAHPWALWIFAMLVTIVFTAMNQMLNVALGPGPGKVLAMALLMLQILSSNGLYPVETEPKIFQWLHPVNPWTYSVNGFRQLMYGNLDERLPQAILALIIVGVICVGITALCAYRDRKWTVERLHPAIDV